MITVKYTPLASLSRLQMVNPFQRLCAFSMGSDGFQLVFMSWRKFRSGFVPPKSTAGTRDHNGFQKLVSLEKKLEKTHSLVKQLLMSRGFQWYFPPWIYALFPRIRGLESTFLWFQMNSPSSIEIYWNQQQGLSGLRIQTKANHGSGKQGEGKMSLVSKTCNCPLPWLFEEYYLAGEFSLFAVYWLDPCC